MSVTEMIGWDLLYKLIENDLKTETDIIIGLTHWYLIKQAGFRCLGTGDEKTLRDNEEDNSTELLPVSWNENSTAYSLRYVHDHKVYILLGTVANDTIILNLLNGEPLQVTNTALHIKDTVKTMHGNLLTLVPNIRNVLGRLKRELLEPVVAFDSNTTTSETQTITPEPQSSRRIPDPDILPNTTPDVLRVQPRIIDPLRDIGRGDLDPLNRGGGGMLFNPPFNNPNIMQPQGPNRNRLPGMVPGARFDPFGPIDPFNNTLNRPGPNPDHLPPPGFEDMFM